MKDILANKDEQIQTLQTANEAINQKMQHTAIILAEKEATISDLNNENKWKIPFAV